MANGPLSFQNTFRWLPYRHYFARAVVDDCVNTSRNSPLRGSLEFCLIRSPAVHGQSIITDMTPTDNRPQCETAATGLLWTDGRSAPSLAVFDAVPRTGGLGILQRRFSPLPEVRQRTYPAAGYEVFKGQAGAEEPHHIGTE